MLIPLHMLRHGETVFLDDYTVERICLRSWAAPYRWWVLDGFDLADALLCPERKAGQDNGRS